MYINRCIYRVCKEILFSEEHRDRTIASRDPILPTRSTCAVDCEMWVLISTRLEVD